MDANCRECGGEIDEGVEGCAICLACAERQVYAATRDPALVASDEEREGVRELVHHEWTGDGWSNGPHAIAAAMLAQIRDRD